MKTPDKSFLYLQMSDIHCDKKTQTKARNIINTTPMTKNRARFIELLPNDGFSGDLNVDKWREIFLQIKKESDKDVKKYMLGRVLELFFASGWGWFMRSGDSLSGHRRETHQISSDRRKGAVTVLKMLKHALYDTRQWTRWSLFFEQTMREYGAPAKPNTKAEKLNQASEKIIQKKRGVLHKLLKTINNSRVQ